jgi:hypothetical protein
MHRGLLERFIEASTLLLVPITPHTSEHVWTNLLKKQGSVLTAGARRRPRRLGFKPGAAPRRARLVLPGLGAPHSQPPGAAKYPTPTPPTPTCPPPPPGWPKSEAPDFVLQRAAQYIEHTIFRWGAKELGM